MSLLLIRSCTDNDCCLGRHILEDIREKVSQNLTYELLIGPDGDLLSNIYLDLIGRCSTRVELLNQILHKPSNRNLLVVRHLPYADTGYVQRIVYQQHEFFRAFERIQKEFLLPAGQSHAPKMQQF